MSNNKYSSNFFLSTHFGYFAPYSPSARTETLLYVVLYVALLQCDSMLQYVKLRLGARYSMERTVRLPCVRVENRQYSWTRSDLEVPNSIQNQKNKNKKKN